MTMVNKETRRHAVRLECLADTDSLVLSHASRSYAFASSSYRKRVVIARNNIGKRRRAESHDPNRRTRYRTRNDYEDRVFGNPTERACLNARVGATTVKHR